MLRNKKSKFKSMHHAIFWPRMRVGGGTSLMKRQGRLLHTQLEVAMPPDAQLHRRDRVHRIERSHCCSIPLTMICFRPVRASPLLRIASDQSSKRRSEHEEDVDGIEYGDAVDYLHLDQNSMERRQPRSVM